MEANSDEEMDEQRPCEFCNGCYKSKKILLEHVRGIHKPKYFCKDCQTTLNNHKSYEKHLKAWIMDLNLSWVLIIVGKSVGSIFKRLIFFHI